MAASKQNEIPGTERAAILLLALGEADAAEVLKHLDPREVETVSAVMARLGPFSPERGEAVLKAFEHRLANGGPLQTDGTDYVRKVLTQLFGKQRAEVMLERLLVGGQGAGIEALRWMEPRVINQIIGDEHPQVIASVLSQLEGKISAQVVPLMDEKLRTEVLMRIAKLEELPQAALAELDHVVGKKAANGPQSSTRKIGGTRTVADIVNALDRDTGDSVMLEIESQDAELHQKIKELLFTFDDLKEVDDKGIQALLREVSSDVLAVALRGADPQISDKIYRNMSKRAGEILREDMEARGPVKLTEVEQAQREIVGTALKMSEEGTLILGNSAGEYV